MARLANRTAIVTGGASGIGESTVRALHAVPEIVDSNEERGHALVQELSTERAMAFTANACYPAARKAWRSTFDRAR